MYVSVYLSTQKAKKELLHRALTRPYIHWPVLGVTRRGS